MGLDMTLYGKKFLLGDQQKEDGFPVRYRILELGYWRKHPDLHGYIVQTFNHGVDDCSDIELSTADLEKILRAVEKNELPYTKGFFFGMSTPDRKGETIEILKKAIDWIKASAEREEYSYVVYRASW